jgi:hypothetical protein
VQDLSSLHLVFIQTAPSTKYIPDDTLLGDWDPVTRIFTLEGNISEPVVITEDNLTLDGAGFTISGSGSYGVELRERTDVTIKNLNIQECIN